MGRLDVDIKHSAFISTNGDDVGKITTTVDGLLIIQAALHDYRMGIGDRDTFNTLKNILFEEKSKWLNSMEGNK